MTKATIQTTTAPATAVKPDRAEIRRALNELTVAGQAFEIRAIDVKVGNKLVATSRVCRTVATGIATAVESWTARGTYFTLNPLKPETEKNAKDADVLERRWLLVDVDAVRAVAGVQNATETEKQSAIGLGYAIRDSLGGLGWPPPIVIDSGNGCHLLYRIQLPNDDEGRDLVKAVLAELARRFDNDAAKVDTGVFNAARISKLPGTVVRKGPATAERPHRVGRLIDVPTGREIVTRGMLAAIAGKPPAGDGKPAKVRAEDDARSINDRGPGDRLHPHHRPGDLRARRTRHDVRGGMPDRPRIRPAGGRRVPPAHGPLQPALRAPLVGGRAAAQGRRRLQGRGEARLAAR